MFLNFLFAQVCSRFSHLIQDTRQFLEQLKHVDCSDSDIFVKLDVKDYFLTGDAHFLACVAASFFSGSEAQFVKCSTFFLLTHQFVECGLLGTQQLYRVSKGSGMGLAHSGALSDLVLAHCAERFLSSQVHAPKCFFRFRDDVVCIFQNRESMKAFVGQYKHECKPYRIMVEDISCVAVDFLEVSVSKDPASGSFVVYPRIKPTSLGTFMLSNSSMHNKHTLNSWPLGVHEKTLELVQFFGLMAV